MFSRRRSIRRLARHLLVTIISATLLVGLAPAAWAATLTVDSSGDAADVNIGDGICDADAGAPVECTLRAAIQEANFSTADSDTIEFELATETIAPASKLPDITDEVLLDGTTDGDVDRIELDGSAAGAINIPGFKITGGGTTVRGFVINGFSGPGIYLDQLGFNIIQRNFIGTDTLGLAADGNDNGILIGTSSDNLIGGNDATQRNVISGNDRMGIFISNAGTSRNIVTRNFIGTDAAGVTDLGNGDTGVYMDSASSNEIGGDDIAERNVISGNGGQGVWSIGGATNVVSGNYIGTDAAGTSDLGNDGHGVLSVSPSTVVGGDTAAERNVISGNGRDGVVAGGVISGNYIGTDATGSADLGNTGNGISSGGAATIGGDTAGERNVVSGNGASGIELHNAEATTLTGNVIGTDVNGQSDLGNAGHGIIAWSSTTVGGDTAAERNVISGNDGDGIHVEAAAATAGVFSGNYIGTGADGTADLGNTLNGISLSNGASATIGGDTPGERNVISGNGGDGVSLAGSATDDNVIEGNYIGVDVTGTSDVGNAGGGVKIDGAPENLVGGTTTAARNVISGNDSTGVRVSGVDARANVIAGNYIGTDAAGATALGNGGGVQIIDAPDAVVGGDTAPERNVISANGTGVSIGAQGAVVSGNYIGTDAAGTQRVGTQINGVAVNGSSNTIGGDTPGERNVVSGNSVGVFVLGFGDGSFSTHNVVSGNYIGTDAAGTGQVANTSVGVWIHDADLTAVGGSTTGERNVISGNGAEGVVVTGFSGGTLVAGNFIGTDAAGVADIGNTGHGVLLDSDPTFAVDPDAVPAPNVVGGPAAAAANRIWFNDGDGVFVKSGRMHSVLSNAISDNGGLGIDLGPNGVTANDAVPDADAGANDLSNFPVITALGGGKSSTAVVVGTLRGVPNTTYTVQFFKGACDPSGFGEGAALLGSHTITLDLKGVRQFEASFVGTIESGTSVTGTATGPTGSTSEFSQCKVAR